MIKLKFQRNVMKENNFFKSIYKRNQDEWTKDFTMLNMSKKL